MELITSQSCRKINLNISETRYLLMQEIVLQLRSFFHLRVFFQVIA